MVKLYQIIKGDKKMKKVGLLLTVVSISLSIQLTAYAGWENADNGNWKYKDEATDQYYNDGWHWIDSDGDGTGECYYFDNNGLIIKNTTTPDGYIVNADGKWVQKGSIKTRFMLYDTMTEEQKNEYFLSNWSQYLDQIATYIQSGNHMSVLAEMERTKYSNMIEALPHDKFVYLVDSGSGLQINKEYMYYGSLVNGMAEGEGTMYKTESGKTTRYGYFIGEWKGDAPNGYGDEYIFWNNDAKMHTFGNFVNWYQYGDMTSIAYQTGKQQKTYNYKIVDKFPVGIGVTKNGNGVKCTVVAYPKENNGGFLTFYDSAQTVLRLNIDDGIRKNGYGYWN